MKLIEKLRKFFNNNPFKGFYKKNRMRPPGAVREDLFMERCIRCARCIEVCPFNSIKRADIEDKFSIGTPYIYSKEKACYLCMKCPSVCPTGALENNLTEIKKVDIGIATINKNTCYNYLFVNDENKGGIVGTKDTVNAVQICNTCYNVCPFPDEAILLKNFILPVVTDKCVGCGICVERCPITPKAINIVPTGMGDKTRTGFYYDRSKIIYEKSKKKKSGYYSGEELLNKKRKISTKDAEKDLKNDFNTDYSLEDWE